MLPETKNDDMGFFAASKDRMIETMALPALNRTFLKPYGQATSLNLDSANRSAEVVLELIGEDKPLRLAVNGYDLTEKGGEHFITIHRISTSRQWLSTVAENLIVNRPWKLPAEVASKLIRFA